MVIHVLYGKDDTGKTYIETGNDTKAYESIIARAKEAMDAGRKIDFDPATVADLRRYEANIFASGGRLGGSLF